MASLSLRVGDGGTVRCHLDASAASEQSDSAGNPQPSLPSLTLAEATPPASPPPLLAADSEISFNEPGVPECVLCMRSIALSCVGGACAHHFCAACLLQWCAASERKDCPTCRAPLKMLLLDPEFDQLCGAGTRRPNDLRPWTATMHLQPDEHAGSAPRPSPGPVLAPSAH